MDSDEFRKAVAGVKPLKHARRVALKDPAPTPEPRQRQRDEIAALAESLEGPLSVDDALDSGEELSYLRDGLSRQVLRRLRRGHWVVQAGLDLHGLNRHDALLQSKKFLEESLRRGLRCVRIVHGKGLGSPNRESVLKGVLRRWLPQQLEIVAYTQAPVAQGGSGAVLVLLNAKRQLR